MAEKGKVYLVGAGPGDPALITVKGLECIRKADVIIYDHLVDDRLLSQACPEAELIYVGKRPQSHTMSQDEINNLLVSRAKQDKVVVRLKGGDPFVFGRGGEEAEALASHQIPFELVPGVPAAVAAPAYAGIPVSHRGLASSFAVVTGHEDPSKDRSSIAWDKLSTGVDTLVFLMGARNLPQIVEQLIQNGRSPATPIALIRHGSVHSQQTIVGTLEDIVTQARNFEPPVVIIVGEVVRLRDRLRWFDNRPLFGKKVLVTRARHQASALSKLLMEHGAEAVEMPTIEIEATPDHRGLDKAISSLSEYNWVIFTSTNAVEVFFDRLHANGLDSREFGGIRVCAIGPATSGALEKRGLLPDYVPQEYASEGIVAGFKKQNIRGSRILLPRAEAAGEELLEGLSRLGARVEQVAIYRTVPPGDVVSRGKQMLLKGEIDIVTFTSSSTVRNLVSILGDKSKALDGTRVACIGPITAATAAELGIRVDIVAEEHTIPGLVRSIEQAYDRP